MDFDEVADEAYAADRDEFVAVRDARAKDARAEGDRELAERIRGLRKPIVAAWLVNQVVRKHPGEVDALAELGESLRQAHQKLAGDRLRSLSRERHELIGKLTDRARSTAKRAGHPVNDTTAQQVEATFEAALADADALAVLRTGRLASALTVESSDQWLTAATGSAPVKKQPREKPAPQRKERDSKAKRDQEEKAAEDARKAAEDKAADARRARDEAERAMADAEREAEDAAAQVSELRNRLREAERAEREARKHATATRRTFDAADRASNAAERELERHQ